MTHSGGDVRPERLRFVAFDFERLANGRCAAEVRLAWGDGAPYLGRSEGLGSEAGELRCVSEATIRAIEEAIESRVRLELLGVKAVRAFDAYVTIVSLAAHDGTENRRLVGSFLSEDHAPRGAAVAVLNATNRLLGNVILRDL